MTEKTGEQSGVDRAAMKTKKKIPPRQTAAWMIFGGAIVLAVLLAVVLPGGSSGIALPSDNTAAAYDVVTEQTQYDLTSADITTDNVQQVIASLERPSAYSVSVTNTLYWDGDWEEIQATQYVRDGVCLTEYDDAAGNAELFEAVSGDQYYAWRRDGSTQYSGSTGSISADDIGMIPTYETVIEEETEDIIEAGLRTVNSESCIYVTVADTETGYSLTYWVSTVSGLLIQADYTRGSELVRSVVIDNIQQELPTVSLFIMPDGSSLLPEETE